MSFPSPGTESAPVDWVAAAVHSVTTWGSVQPMIQGGVLIGTVLIAAIAAVTVIKLKQIKAAASERETSGIPVSAFVHVIEEQARQSEYLRASIDELRATLTDFSQLLTERVDLVTTRRGSFSHTRRTLCQ